MHTYSLNLILYTCDECGQVTVLMKKKKLFTIHIIHTNSTDQKRLLRIKINLNDFILFFGG